MPKRSAMSSHHLQNGVRKFCVLAAVSLILPALSYAGTDMGKGNNGQNNGNQYGKGKDQNPPMVSTPEANTGMVLIPFFGAILLFSAYRYFRPKAAGL